MYMLLNQILKLTNAISLNLQNVILYTSMGGGAQVQLKQRLKQHKKGKKSKNKKKTTKI